MGKEESDRKKMLNALKNLQKANEQIEDVSYNTKQNESYIVLSKELNSFMRDLSGLIGETD